MIFYKWVVCDYVRVGRTGFSEFKRVKKPGQLNYGGEFPTCPKCGVRIGTLQWQRPHVVQLTTKKLGDFCTDGIEVLVSKRFREAWCDYGLTGLELIDEPIQIKGVIPDTVGYKLALPPFVITRLDEVASGLVIDKLAGCDFCRVVTRKKIDRLRIDETSWTGLDVFRPSGLIGVVVVTERFVKMVEECSLTNFHFIHQDDYREPIEMRDLSTLS